MAGEKGMAEIGRVFCFILCGNIQNIQLLVWHKKAPLRQTLKTSKSIYTVFIYLFIFKCTEAIAPKSTAKVKIWTMLAFH